MKLRIILLLDSLEVSAWVWEAIFQVFQSENAEIVLAGINQNPKSSGKKSPFLYRVYRYLDRKLFTNPPDAFSKKDLRTIPNWKIPILSISPIQKKFSDYLNSDTIRELQGYQPDIVLRFGFRILRGEILDLPKLGVWSYHHGDIRAFRGGPPCFWEVMNQSETTGAVLQQLNQKLDDGLVLYQGRFQTDPLSVQRNANKVFWNSSYFIFRVLRQISVLGLEKWKQNLLENQENVGAKSEILTPPGSYKMLSSWVKLWSRNAFRKGIEQFQKPHWELTVAKRLNHQFIPDHFEVISSSCAPHKKGSFWADPFPVDYQGECWVFYEEYDGAIKKGKIGVGLWDGKTLRDCQIVLEESWHLSYPFIWKENGEFYLIPESGEAGKTYLYKATKFPYNWDRVGEFFIAEAYDPTLHKIGDKYWLFVNQKAHPGSSAFVELNAYWSSSLENPVWVPHALNPVVSDVVSSRPAGTIVEHQGKLFRPAQDSGKRYGHQIRIQEILVLTETEYQEKTVQLISPDASQGILGTHTLNFSEKWAFSDRFYRK